LPLLLGKQAAFNSTEHQELLAHSLVIRSRHRLIEAKQRFIGIDPLPLPNEYLSDDATLQVLHRFSFGVDND
jgi:hypothetical protein